MRRYVLCILYCALSRYYDCCCYPSVLSNRKATQNCNVPSEISWVPNRVDVQTLIRLGIVLWIFKTWQLPYGTVQLVKMHGVLKLITEPVHIGFAEQISVDEW